ncbi:hypothetical protein JNAJLEEC_00049 [Pseudomonas phage phiPA01_302]|nr:hypothetical protein JNAJLEEC_00049 [Pseudomonas phage phiPA01_302]
MQNDQKVKGGFPWTYIAVAALFALLVYVGYS